MSVDHLSILFLASEAGELPESDREARPEEEHDE